VLADIAGCDLPAGGDSVVRVQVEAADVANPAEASMVRTSPGSDGTPAIQLMATADGFIYDVEGVARFFIASSGDYVGHSIVPGAAIHDIDHFLAGPVLGLAFQLRGGIALHASAVMIDGQAVAFSAGHGAGKSTLATNLGVLGLPVVTDDVLALRAEGDGWTAIRSLPRAKLWGDSLEALGRSVEQFGTVVSWLGKRRITIGRDFGSLAPEELPLGAIYLLDPRSSERELEIAPIEGSQAALMLLGNMYMPEAIRGPRTASTLDAAIAMTSRVPVRRITYYRSYEAFTSIRDAVLADLVSLEARG
jgi:hypothetical protein